MKQERESCKRRLDTVQSLHEEELRLANSRQASPSPEQQSPVTPRQAGTSPCTSGQSKMAAATKPDCPPSAPARQAEKQRCVEDGQSSAKATTPSLLARWMSLLGQRSADKKKKPCEESTVLLSGESVNTPSLVSVSL